MRDKIVNILRKRGWYPSEAQIAVAREEASQYDNEDSKLRTWADNLPGVRRAIRAAVLTAAMELKERTFLSADEIIDILKELVE